jgi:hypothetical protein
MTAALAERAGAAELAVATGRGFASRSAVEAGAEPAGALCQAMAGLGFAPDQPPSPETPELLDGLGRADAADSVVHFGACPFHDLAVAHPALVCGLHQGMCEGVVAATGRGTIVQFHRIDDSAPCRAEIHVA